ncbi:MAG: hypothetical protein A2W25_11670 [candidate division Zixibacteria bacterium RBG_16_53_22]|nr:MAG: hypothetical protein A2W25_11670 [candidate division Zixibacteria bacterium RBG_16_53_22]
MASFRVQWKANYVRDKFLQEIAQRQAEREFRSMWHFNEWVRWDPIDFPGNRLERSRREKRAVVQRNYFMARWYQMDQMRRFVRRVFGDGE